MCGFAGSKQRIRDRDDGARRLPPAFAKCGLPALLRQSGRSSAPYCQALPAVVIPWVKRLTKPERLRKSLFHGGDRSPSCGTSAPAGVPKAKGIRPLGRQCHRPSSNTASLGDEGV